MTVNVICEIAFQSTLPMRGVTLVPAPVPALHRQFQSTLPMRGVTGNVAIDTGVHVISIHTPHAGSDSNFNQNILLSFSQNQ